MATKDPWSILQPQELQAVMTITEPVNNIIFNSGSDEMLRISEDGFYVRGVKLKQDDNEIKEVYNCFKEWLTWTTLNR